MRDDETVLDLVNDVGDAVTPKGERQPLPLTEEYVGWSLGDVLKFSDASRNKSGQITVHTAMDDIKDSRLTVDCGNSFNIDFKVENPDDFLSQTMKKLEANDLETADGDDDSGAKTIDVKGYGKIAVSVGNREPAKVNITFGSDDTGIDVEDTLKAMGLKDLMKINTLPNTPEEALSKKYVEFHDGRTVPVLEADNRDELQSLAQPPSGENMRLIHGTNFSKAMSVSEEGLFALDDPKYQNPTVSEGWNDPFEAAKGKAENGWQAYLIIECKPDEYKNQEGFKDRIGIPAVPYKGNRDRLQDKIPDMWNNPNLTWMPPERVKQVILMKSDRN
jgi:hypothetical protein